MSGLEDAYEAEDPKAEASEFQLGALSTWQKHYQEIEMGRVFNEVFIGILLSVSMIIASLAQPTMCSRAAMIQACDRPDEKASCGRANDCRSNCVETFFSSRTGCDANPERFYERIQACCHACNQQFCRAVPH